jgi:hypothetical protein
MVVKEKNLDLGLDVVDGVAALNLESDGLSSQSFDEDLHLVFLCTYFHLCTNYQSKTLTIVVVVINY